MIEYLMGSVVLAIVGIAVVIAVLRAAFARARRQQELARKREEISSEQELETYINRIDQALTTEDLDHPDGNGRGTT